MADLLAEGALEGVRHGLLRHRARQLAEASWGFNLGALLFLVAVIVLLWVLPPLADPVSLPGQAERDVALSERLLWEGGTFLY